MRIEIKAKSKKNPKIEKNFSAKVVTDGNVSISYKETGGEEKFEYETLITPAEFITIKPLLEVI